MSYLGNFSLNWKVSQNKHNCPSSRLNKASCGTLNRRWHRADQLLPGSPGSFPAPHHLPMPAICVCATTVGPCRQGAGQLRAEGSLVPAQASQAGHTGPRVASSYFVAWKLEAGMVSLRAGGKYWRAKQAVPEGHGGGGRVTPLLAIALTTYASCARVSPTLRPPW